MFVLLLLLAVPVGGWYAAHDMCLGVRERVSASMVERCIEPVSASVMPPVERREYVRRFGVDFSLARQVPESVQQRARSAERLADLPFGVLE